MTVLGQMRQFSDRYGKTVTVEGVPWRYHRLGSGPPILWLTGGLRRTALGYRFMEGLAARHTVVAPDYPPARTIDEFFRAFDAILAAEGLGSVTVIGQSYGGILAQAYLAHRPGAVERLILSSSGPADYGRAWLPVEWAFIALVRLLPGRAVKRALTRGLLTVVTLPEAERSEWVLAIDEVVKGELSRADVVSHFAVAADCIRKRIVSPPAFEHWTGPVVVLSADNDPTQGAKDIPRYERLFGRSVHRVSLGEMGHTAVLFDPGQFVTVVERAVGDSAEESGS